VPRRRLRAALACDLRVAAARAIFGLPEVRVAASVIQAALLPPMIGPGARPRCC